MECLTVTIIWTSAVATTGSILVATTDEEEGETIIYAESPEEALRRFYYINGYTDRDEQEDFSAKLCKELKDVKRGNFYRMDFYNDNDRYELVKHLHCTCEEKSAECSKCVARSICRLWNTEG